MEIFRFIFAVFLSVSLLLATTYYLRKFVWVFSPLFFFLNYIQWIFYNPLRFIFKSPTTETARKVHLFLMTTLLAPLYWVIIHLLMTPLRVVNSLYFDVLLYWSVMLDDTISEVFNPKRGPYRTEKGLRYFFHWIYGFPLRLLSFFSKCPLAILDSFLMLGISSALPTLTFYHGTSFNKSATNIGQTGKWKVGGGDHAGSGIYFGIREKVAQHYSPGGEDSGILITRVTTTFTRNQATLKKEVRQLVGRDGQQLSKKLSFPWSTIEHWRTDLGGWWEYCLVQPGKAGTFIDSWRIRPVAVIKNKKISRLWGGFSNYSVDFASIFMGSLCWLFLVFIFYSLN